MQYIAQTCKLYLINCLSPFNTLVLHTLRGKFYQKILYDEKSNEELIES